MASRRHGPKGRLLLTGSVLLLLLTLGIVITLRTVNRIAMQMSDRVIVQVSDYHYRLLKVEFTRSQELLETAVSFLKTHPQPTSPEIATLATTLLQLDRKAGTLWLATPDRSILLFAADGMMQTTTWETDSHAELLATMGENTSFDGVADFRGEATWSMVRRIAHPSGQEIICGIDFPLFRIHNRIIEQNPFSRSTATLFDRYGRIIYHPDSLKLGKQTDDKEAIEALRNIAGLRTNVATERISDFTQLTEKRIYYPIPLGCTEGVAAIGIPQVIIEQEINAFHRYTLLSAVIALLFFAVLLIIAQRRWRREYELRRRSEQESAQLQLQQVLDRIDPHFLFNSLNSLYALIRHNPDEAREYTLALSRVYRQVLERRNRILIPLADEIDFTWQYYKLQKIRYGERIELSVRIDPQWNNHLLPAMSLQTQVENALKHNCITRANPLRIHIYTRQEELVIENNYTPKDKQAAESLGIGLDRIRSVYDFYTSENLTLEATQEKFICIMPLLAPDM